MIFTNIYLIKGKNKFTIELLNFAEFFFNNNKVETIY